ncbi:MAG: proline--tRNA ligase [Nanoarchaeota archaeon]|nr:proline--tRNA ligase [Nanoarchaeota archaeon]
MAEEKDIKGITVKKADDFSEWYSQVVQKAELADLRYNLKGFVCYMPWAVISIKKMYEKYEKLLEKNGHLPLIMPSLIPESNFHMESSHVEGFAPQVFWVTEAGNEKFEERLALRPTSETALYKMYSLWIRSYKDLPFKRYQSCQVWRYEGKATRPFFRAREFHWIEAHNVFATEEEARKQVLQDMEMTYQMLEQEFSIPIIFFERPQWDKFAGAVSTYAADALTESGKVIQLPSTHLLGTNFSKPFNVKFIDKDASEKYGFITCYGPAISRIYGAMVAILGDDKGIVLPFDLAPVQIVIVPILFKGSKEKVLEKCEEAEAMLKGMYSVQLDARDDMSAGEKFSKWELKGVPFRIEIGPKDVETNVAVVVNRFTKEKKAVDMKQLGRYIDEAARNYTRHLKEKKLFDFNSLIQKCETLEEAKKAIENKKIVCCGFCSLGMDAVKCAEVIETDLGAFVRGRKVTEEKNHFSSCIVCGKKAKDTVYIARSY